MTLERRIATALLTTLLGCAAETGALTGEPGSSGTTGTPPPQSDSDPPGEPKSDTTTGGADEEPELPPTPTTGSWDDYPCDTWKQDCPEGQKCTMYSKDGGLDLNASKCAPIPPEPAQYGELCTAPQGAGHGDDTCDEGGLCIGLGPQNTGVCAPFCAGSMGAPECPEEMLCTRGVGQLVYLCRPTCDPLAQDCIEGEVCVFASHDEGYACAADVSGEGGQIYDDCQFANSCDEGLGCGPPTVAPNCAQGPGQGCCLPFCEVGVDECPDGLECLPLHDEGEFDTVGLCAAPG